jgi:hypothetical protein
MAAVIVGSQSTENFELAYQFTSAWEEVGGCYWCLQVEVARFHAIYKLRYISFIPITQFISHISSEALSKATNSLNLQQTLKTSFEGFDQFIHTSAGLKTGLDDLRNEFRELIKSKVVFAFDPQVR